MPDRITATELRFERLLPAPIETVWDYLIDGDKRARWFMGGATDARVGGAIGMTMQHDDLSDGDVPTPAAYAEHLGKSWDERITRIEPPHVLAFTWEDGKAGEVTITLTPDGDRTRLVLHHTGLRGPDDAKNFGGGWAAHLAVLECRLAREPVPDFWALHAAAEAKAAAALG